MACKAGPSSAFLTDPILFRHDKTMTCKLQIYNMFTYLMLFESSLKINSEILIIEFITPMLHCGWQNLFLILNFAISRSRQIWYVYMLQQLFIYENFFNDSMSTFLFKKESLPRLFNSLEWIWLGLCTRWSIWAILPYQNSQT